MQEEDMNFYELHYVLNGVKKALVVEKVTMTELHAWLCVLLIVRGETAGSPNELKKPLRQAADDASALGIFQVRWNKTVLGSGHRPEIKFSVDWDADALTMSTGNISLDKYRNNLP
jgi:hypothetical protein